jgi:integrase
MGRHKAGARVTGPYFDSTHKDYVLHVYLDGEEKPQKPRFATEADAEQYAEGVRRGLVARARLTVDEAITEFAATITGTTSDWGARVPYDLRRLLQPLLRRPVTALTPRAVAQAYEALTARPAQHRAWRSGETRQLGRRLSADYHRKALRTAKRFGAWLADPTRQYLIINPFTEVKGTGALRAGKPQLTTDEARVWYACALGRAQAGDVAALAALTVLLLGCRPSEVLRRNVRDLDAVGTVLQIFTGKNKRAQRRPKIPQVLQPLLLKQAAGKFPLDLLFPGDGAEGRHAQNWMINNVRRICRAAGVPDTICAYSLRGMWTSLYVDSRDLATEEVAAHLARAAAQVGHRPAVTERHYVAPGVLSDAREREQDARQDRLLEVLKGS